MLAHVERIDTIIVTKIIRVLSEDITKVAKILSLK